MSRKKNAGFQISVFRMINKGGIMMRKAVLVRSKDKVFNRDYEPTFQVGMGSARKP